MKKERKYIKIFAVTLFLIITISVNAEVRAETNYYDDNGIMYRLVFDDTPLKNFVQRDFALYYNQKDLQNEDIAILTNTSQSGTYTYSMGFAKNKNLNIEIYETSQNWQETKNEKYIAIILPDYISCNKGTPKINENIKLKKQTNNKYWFFGNDYKKQGVSGINLLNFNKNESNVAFRENIEYYEGSATADIVIVVNKDGIIKRVSNLWDTNENLINELNKNARSNLIYSSVDVYDNTGTTIIKPKEDFEVRKDIIVKKEIKVNPNESNEINFKIYNLKKNDKIKFIKKDKNGNYTENDIIETTITIDLNENQSYLIKDENVKENKIYDIKIYNSKNEIIYNEEYIHNMKNYVLEDTTKEKNKLINLEDYKINNKLTNVIKNVFIISNKEYLGKLIFLVFTITIIAIIRKKV